jgi:hypothetical protein
MRSANWIYGALIASVTAIACGENAGLTAVDANSSHCPDDVSPSGVCQENICWHALEFEVLPPGTWAPGAYQIDLLAEDEPIVCAFEVPATNPDAEAEPVGAHFGAQCDTRPWEVRSFATCTDAGCTADQRLLIFARREPIWFGGELPPVTPSRVEIRITGPQGELLERTIEPEYTCTANCPPCVVAYEQLDVR